MLPLLTIYIHIRPAGYSAGRISGTTLIIWVSCGILTMEVWGGGVIIQMFSYHLAKLSNRIRLIPSELNFYVIPESVT